jgi:ribosomal protein L7/L12
MNQIFLPIVAMAIACLALVAVAAMRMSQLGDHLLRQEAKLNLILAKMEIAFPPPPSAAVQAIAATHRVAAVKAYRQETGLGLKQALDIVDQWRAKQQG